MNESKHTPEPWVLESRDSETDDYWFIRSPDKGEEPDELLAIVYHEADGRLMAAAPDLLEALEDAMRWFAKLEDWSGVGDPDIDKYRAAIAKAKGE